MPTFVIKPDTNQRAYKWGAKAEMKRGWLRLSQEQGEPNGLQIVLLTPLQARELVAAYRKQYA